MTDIRTDTANRLTEPLTEREREILGCLVGGLSNQEIAARLHLALRTVKWYNTQIYDKLGVGSRKEAIELATTSGLLKAAADTPEFTPRNNLPLQPTRFVGRQHELANIASQFADPNIKLVTILAPGGMGKTRFALAVAEREVRNFKDGVFFVPMAALRSPDDIITAIADNVGFSFYGSASPRDQLLDYFRDRHMLLVLDNFEHLLDGALLVADILQAALGLRVLATSREQLSLRGETVYSLRGLDFPTSETPERVQESDAGKLFILSAQRIHPGFEIKADDLTHLARICQLTAGMPLAIELAAGWFDTLSLAHIVDEIQRGIDILETDLRDLPERHRSIRTIFEFTWKRLTAEEQAIFSSLSVFRGRFSLSAALTVAGASARHLRGLTQKALIQTEGNERFTIHELLRQFGADKLAAAGKLPNTQAKHAAFFADFMQEREGSIFGNHQLEALDQIGADFENIRLAWKVLVERQAFEELPKFLDGLWFFLNVRNRWQEGIELFEATTTTLQSLPTSDVNELALARLWARLAWFYNYIGFSEKGKATAEAAIRLLTQHNSPDDLLVAYRNLALISMLRGEYDIQRQAAEAGYELAHKLGNRSQEAHSLIQFSFAANMVNNDIDASLRPLRQARAIFEELGDKWGLMLSYTSEAGSAFQAEDYQQAKQWLTQSQSLAQAFGSAYYAASCALYLGIVTLEQNNYRQAWDLLRQSLRTFWDAGYTHFALAPVLRIAQLVLYQDNPEFAVEILASMDHYPAHHRYYAQFESHLHSFEELRTELQTLLGIERFSVVWLLGQGRELSAVVADLLSDDIDE
jgi:DNA-binding CsgD family transcriptional regulator/tetratricopeptide (TPR) repeat protein